MKKSSKFANSLFTFVLCALLVTSGFAGLVSAGSGSVCLLEMPEEYIEYRVCEVNGSLWAKVDGTYPISKIALEQNVSEFDNLFTFSDESLAMCYPTPLGTTNITIKVDDTELSWSNYTELIPEAVHYTAIGNWPMIACEVSPVSDQFVLKIHYEHPIMQQNDSYVFLYDLNISPYLSPWSNKSTAYFTIKFETDVTNLKATTIAMNGTTKPADYTVTKEDTTQTITLQVTSEYAKQLLGDLLISFQENKDATHAPFYSIIVVVAVGATVLTAHIVMKHKKRSSAKTANQQSY